MAKAPRSLQTTRRRAIPIDEHLDFARGLARQLHGRLPDFVDIDDLESDAFFGLLKATRKFDPARRVPFRVYAAKRIVGQMLDGLRQRNQVRRYQPVIHLLSLDGEVNGLDGEFTTLGGTLADDTEPVGQRLEMQDEAAYVLRRLRPSSREHLINLYLRGQTQAQIAESLGVTAGAVSQRLRQIQLEIARVQSKRAA